MLSMLALVMVGGWSATTGGQTPEPANPLRPSTTKLQHQRSIEFSPIFDRQRQQRFDLVLRPGVFQGEIFSDRQLADFAAGENILNHQPGATRQKFADDLTHYDPLVRPVTYDENVMPDSDSAGGFSAFSNVEVAAFDTPVMPVPAASQNLSSSNQQHNPALNSNLTAEALPPGSQTPGAPTGPTSAAGSAVAAAEDFRPALPSGFSNDLPISQQFIGELFEAIQRQKDLLSSSPESEDEERVRLTKVLDESYSSLVQAKNLQKKDFLQRNGIRMFEADKQILEDKLAVDSKPQMPVGKESAEDLFSRLEDYRQKMDDLNSQLHELSKIELQHKVRLGEIPKDRATSRKRIAEIKKQLKNEELSNADTVVMIRLRAEELELEYRIESLDSESKLYELQNRLLPLESDLLARQVKILETEIEAWNTAANDRRRMDLEAEAREARAQVIDAAPALRELATLNAELTERRIKFTELIRAATDEEIEVKELLNSVRSQHDAVEKSIVDNTLSQANGLLLVDIRRKMVRPFKSRQRIRAINRELQKISLDRLKLNEQREPLSHPNEYAAAMLEGVHSDSISDEELSNMAVEIAESIRQQYDQLSAGHHTYLDLLGKIVAEREELVSEIEATMEFVNQKSLWVRSAQPIGIEQVAKSRYGVAKFFSPQKWTELLGELVNRFVTSPHESVAGLIGLVALFTISRRFKA